MSDIVTQMDPMARLNAQMSSDLVYPFIEIQGIDSQEEIKYLNRISKDLDNSLPLYMAFQGSMQRIGKIQLSVNFLINILSISDYRIILHKDANTKAVIPIDTPEELEQFIKL